jgi:glycosyltransferase involved in cell wall biosynthesis
MKKIVHIITRLDRGGSPEDTLYTCIDLRKQGYECAIIHGISELPPEALMKQASDAGVKFILAPNLVRSISPLKDLSALLKIFSILREEKPDIVHTHTSKAGIIGRWSAWFYKISRNFNTPSPSRGEGGDEGEHDNVSTPSPQSSPQRGEEVITKRGLQSRVAIIHSTHGHVFYGYYSLITSSLFILAERLTAPITDKITVLTENEIDETLKYKIGREGLFTVIHSGIEYRTVTAGADLRNKYNISPDTIVVGSAGRFDPVKGYIDLVLAAKVILSAKPLQKIVFLLTGDGSEMPVLKILIGDPAASCNFILPGWQADVEGHIQACDIYVQPSINEGLGKTILMAQMLGKPIVATKVQGIVSIIEHGKTGLLAKPANPIDLAEKISALINDKQKRLTLGENAKNWICEKDPSTGYYKFSVEQMNALYMKLYLSLLKENDAVSR